MKCDVRRGLSNKCCKTEITFAKIELTNPHAWDALKSFWKKPCFKDISPLGARRLLLNGGIVSKQGNQYLQEMKKINADWYLLVGHHAGMYADDPNLYGSWKEYFNKHDRAGFFNHNYHHGRWDIADHAHPNRGENKRKNDFKLGLFLRTTSISPAPFSQDNPLLEDAMKSSRKTKCKGIILAGCNSLIMKKERIIWNEYYPDSLIFGAVKRLPGSFALIKAIKMAPLIRNLKFWENPRPLLGQPGKLEELTKLVASNFPHMRGEAGLGILFKGQLFVSVYSGTPKLKLSVVKLKYDGDL